MTEPQTAGLVGISAAEARALQRAWVFGHDYWIIPWVSEGAALLSVAIEDRFYAGAANADFQVMASPGPTPTTPGLVVVFAHKRWMGNGDLVLLMNELGYGRANDDGDILLIVPAGEPAYREMAESLIASWAIWLGARP